MNGIYCYIDKKTNFIIYIGKDSYIHKKQRHKDHLNKGKYNQQHINRILQSDLNRYEYKILEKGNISEKILNALEKSFIQKYNPIFNFTKGGDGSLGYKHTLLSKKKVSEGQSIRNSTGFFRVSKSKTPCTTSQISWHYSYRFNGENIDLFSVDINKLERKVKEKGLKWKVIDEEAAKKSLKENKKIQKERKRNSSGYFRVYKRKDDGRYVYRCMLNKKRISIYSKNILELEKKVKKKGLEWKKL